MIDIELLISQEGDFKEWTYRCKNGLEFLCRIKRTELQFLCGYVCIPTDNDLYNMNRDYTEQY